MEAFRDCQRTLKGTGNLNWRYMREEAKACSLFEHRIICYPSYYGTNFF